MYGEVVIFARNGPLICCDQRPDRRLLAVAIEVKKEAIEWVKRCPNPHHEGGEIEIRQVFEAADFGAEFTPQLREQEARLSAQYE
jgi:hypothetical protein